MEQFLKDLICSNTANSKTFKLHTRPAVTLLRRPTFLIFVLVGKLLPVPYHRNITIKACADVPSFADQRICTCRGWDSCREEVFVAEKG